MDDPRRWEVFKAADQIRAEGKERVALRNVTARVKRNNGVAGSNQLVGKHLSAWAEERQYSPIIELAGLPGSVSTVLAKAGVALWEAAQAEAAKVLESERRRMAEAIELEREFRNEALGIVDARDAVIEGLRAEVARQAAEMEEMREHLRIVRAREFWPRVAQEIWEILPEREAMHLNEITGRIGHEFIKEAEDFPGEWGPDLIRGVIDQRIKYQKLFWSEGRGRYRRRRSEDPVRA
jgi:hypothetical protein